MLKSIELLSFGIKHGKPISSNGEILKAQQDKFVLVIEYPDRIVEYRGFITITKEIL